VSQIVEALGGYDAIADTIGNDTVANLTGVFAYFDTNKGKRTVYDGTVELDAQELVDNPTDTVNDAFPEARDGVTLLRVKRLVSYSVCGGDCP
jgi:trans-aconitate methyltransferase